MMDDNPRHAPSPAKDSGLQFERTALAWLRSGFLAMLVAGLTARKALIAWSLPHLASAALLGVLAGCLFWVGYQRGHYPTERGAYAVREPRNAPRCVGLLLAAAAAAQAAITLGALISLMPA
ncbi:Uncharacterised protein [Starkeya nomas]|uniref:DUF202 domain-containing protein n=1 Tax=Starkeya nomas TaxID=2666134 RepID=A0A5S9PWN7_9HYPH|nr:DUF202 domain-containing protein [Starkeya nomas]CAA0109002.1 Uncharacterised protein [Starkeya nomas]